MLLKYINIPLFIVSFFVGLFFVYITMPDMRKIYVYPTPENADSIQYRDKTGNCFSVKQTETKCPTNIEDISRIPSQA